MILCYTVIYIFIFIFVWTYFSDVLDCAILGLKACLRHTYCPHEPWVKSFMSCIKHSQPVNAVLTTCCSAAGGRGGHLQGQVRQRLLSASHMVVKVPSTEAGSTSHKVCLCSLRRFLFSVVNVKSSKRYSITLLHRLLSERQACWTMKQACRQNTYRFVPGMTAHKHCSVIFLAAMAFGSYRPMRSHMPLGVWENAVTGMLTWSCSLQYQHHAK